MNRANKIGLSLAAIRAELQLVRDAMRANRMTRAQCIARLNDIVAHLRALKR